MLNFVKSLIKSTKAQMGIVGIAVALIVGIIGLKIVYDVIANTSFTGLTGTVTSYITIGLAVTLLVLAFAGLMRKKEA